MKNRSNYCGEITKDNIDETVTLCGWSHRRRDHGGVIFIDLRDHTGIAQIVFDPADQESFVIAEHVRSEYVLKVTGLVRTRPEGTVNKEMATGEVELLVNQIEVLNKAKTPPFMIDDNNVHEDNRLKYRYIDLRRPIMQERIKLRAKVTSFLRNFLEQNGFLDIETPMLTRATPEGARDYLVPSRTHQGKFFALPQSPQLFKQLIMMSGFDKYYQIVKCFRDEDLRADRQPEFTQLDLEMAFIDESAIMAIMEVMIRDLFKTVKNIDLSEPFAVLTYQEAINKYGTDRPDLRIPLELIDIADIMQTVEFKVFSNPAKDESCRVCALKIPGGNKLSRKDIDNYTKFVAIYGAKGLAYIKVNDIDSGIDGLQSPILKFLTEDAVIEIMQRVKAKTGDLVFFGADNKKIVNESMAALRAKIGIDLKLLTCDWNACWVTDFPMFERVDNVLTAMHHPFTAIKEQDIPLIDQNPELCYSKAYDLVINGHEVGGGSIRIHQAEIQRKILQILNISPEEAEDKFGFLLKALEYGCPPHGGMAFGLDRLVMLLAGTDTLRDIMAFPKTQSAQCLLTDAPGEASPAQLKELKLKIS